MSASTGGPPFHPRCFHVLTPFVERLATEEEKKAGVISPEVLNRTPAELQRRYREERRQATGRTGSGWHRVIGEADSTAKL